MDEDHRLVFVGARCLQPVTYQSKEVVLREDADFSDGEVTVIMGKVKEWKILPKSIERKRIEEMLPYRFEPKKGLLNKS